MNKMNLRTLLLIIVLIVLALYLISCREDEPEPEKTFYCIEARINDGSFGTTGRTLLDKHCISIEKYTGGINRYPAEVGAYQTWRNGMSVLGMNQQVMNKVSSCNECK